MTKTTKKKTRRKRTDPKLPLEVIAAAVADADCEQVAIVAKRYGVNRTTIHAWRKRGATDPKLRKLISKKRLEALKEWRTEAAATAISIAREVRRRVSEGEDVPFSLIAAAKVYGAMNVEAGALLLDIDEEDNRPDPSPFPPAFAPGSEARH